MMKQIKDLIHDVQQALKKSSVDFVSLALGVVVTMVIITGLSLAL